MSTGENVSWKIKQHFEDENLTKRILNLIKILLVFIEKAQIHWMKLKIRRL